MAFVILERCASHTGKLRVWSSHRTLAEAKAAHDSPRLTRIVYGLPSHDIERGWLLESEYQTLEGAGMVREER